MLTNDEKLVENIKATMAMEGLELHQEDELMYIKHKEEMNIKNQIDIIKKDIISKMNAKNV